MKARIVSIASAKALLYAPWIAEALEEIHGERAAKTSLQQAVEAEIALSGSDPAFLLLVAELVDPHATATATAPAGYVEASLLFTLPWRDPLLPPEGAELRVLSTRPRYRSRGLATSLLRQAHAVLASRGVPELRVSLPYGDDALVGLFERREYMRGRMALHRPLPA